MLATTYQAGTLVMLRAEEGRVNTHFRGFSRPRGLALAGGRLALGTALEVWEFHPRSSTTRSATRSWRFFDKPANRV